MAKKKLVILDENAHWWAKEKLDWATQDKDGNWWIIPGSEFPETKLTQKEKMRLQNKKSGQRSSRADFNFCFSILICSLLGISLAVNLLYVLGVL
tara:strand:- start:319 stop:603 length:285 start_codon:yes stop_codon:yes gene_type:complete